MPLNPQDTVSAPEYYHFSIAPMIDSPEPAPEPTSEPSAEHEVDPAPAPAAAKIPESITLLRPSPTDPSLDQLFINQTPIPKDFWQYDAHDRKLIWKKTFGGGVLTIWRNGRGAAGIVGAGLPLTSLVSVKATAATQYVCDFTLNCGGSRLTDSTNVLDLTWDPTSDAWQKATWIPNKLVISYISVDNGPFVSPSLAIQFTDNESKTHWAPKDDLATQITLTQKNGEQVWLLSFDSKTDPPGARKDPGKQTSIFPRQLLATEDAFMQTINGAMDIYGGNHDVKKDPIGGIQGVWSNPAIAGYLQLTDAHMPFAVFGGKMVIGENTIPASYIKGNTLYWNDLDPGQTKFTGLPSTGALTFSDHGQPLAETGKPTLRKLNTPTSIEAIRKHAASHPIATKLNTELTAASGLDLPTLAAMNPFKQNKSGKWVDQVQQRVSYAMHRMMCTYIPPDLWQQLYPGVKQPVRSGDLHTVASENHVPGAAYWYKSLATAVLTQGLAGRSDNNCKNLNGPRAGAWLNTQMAMSKVYQAHSQVLFGLKWAEQFPIFPQYLRDQENNAASYVDTINAQLTADLHEINQKIDPSNKDTVQKLKQAVRKTAQYAITKKLFWAYAFYKYVSQPAAMNAIENEIRKSNLDPGQAPDVTALSRLYQQNVSVLTALDPTNYFSKQYTQTLNIFMATNILPSYFDYNGTIADISIIKKYIRGIIDTNKESPHPKLKQFAGDLDELLNSQPDDTVLKQSVGFIASASTEITAEDNMTRINRGFQSRFTNAFSHEWTQKVAEGFGALLTTAMAGLNLFKIIMEFDSWDEMSDEEKAQLVLETTDMGMEILAAVVVRGVRMYAIYSVEGLSTAGRAASLGKILVTGETGGLDNALSRLGSSTARWLGGVKTAIIEAAEEEAGPEAIEMYQLDLNEAVAQEEEAAAFDTEVTMSQRFFGRNLDEFMCGRIGPLFILIGIGFSIYQLVEGESKTAQAIDGLSIASGALGLIFAIGSWGVVGEVSMFISACGALSVLAAAVALGLALYQLFQPPPDPVQQFIDDYAAPAGFYVSAKASSIDYALPWYNKQVQTIGFTLNLDPADGKDTGNKFLLCNPDGSISLGAANTLPSGVWRAQTNGDGITQFFARTTPPGKTTVQILCLSLMSDNSISFQPKQSPAPAKPAATKPAASANTPTVTTQQWYTNTQGVATLSADGNYLQSLNLTLQPVLADAAGDYAPCGAKGYVQLSGSTITCGAGASPITIVMSGMAPNFMAMKDIQFISGLTPAKGESFAPTFGIIPSIPLVYTLSGDPLPHFLTFNKKTGVLSTNGKSAGEACQLKSVISIKNAFGEATTNWKINII